MMIRDIEKAYLRSLGKLDQQLVSFALANGLEGCVEADTLNATYLAYYSLTIIHK